MKQKVRIAIALGSNLGDRAANLLAATERLASEFVEDARASQVYETLPWQGMAHPLYLNSVVTGLSEWKPPAILNYLQNLERELGRTPAERYAPRVIDLDLIAYGEMVWESPGVLVPHPHMHDRDFVLAPLVELWPNWRHPTRNQEAALLWAALLKKSPEAPKIFGPPQLDRETQ